MNFITKKYFSYAYWSFISTNTNYLDELLTLFPPF